MVSREDSGLHPVPTPAEAIEEVKKGLWASLPDSVKAGVVILGALSGGGGVSMYVGRWQPPWEAREEAAKVHEKIEARIDALATDLPAALVKALDERDKRRGKR